MSVEIQSHSEFTRQWRHPILHPHGQVWCAENDKGTLEKTGHVVTKFASTILRNLEYNPHEIKSDRTLQPPVLIYQPINPYLQNKTW